MTGYSFSETPLKGAYIIENFSVGDARGRFTKLFEKEIYHNGGIDFSLNETFCSISSKNVIRGLHFQHHNPQAKLVSVIQGRVWDVIVDLRLNSETFGQWTYCELSAENHNAFYVPKGFAHGFLALEDNSIMLYQCDGAYDKESDSGIRYDDKDINIQWPINLEETIHSERDLGLMGLKEYINIPMEGFGKND